MASDFPNHFITPERVEQYFDELWPICRSITGNGLRESFKILQNLIPLKLSEVETGTNVFDWIIPKEWNIEEAYIITPEGKKICDFKVNNLHVVNYSVPIEKELSFEELNNHLYSLPDLPEAIPYVTSYYNEKWGFCISQKDRDLLSANGKYKVVIRSVLNKGSLTYGDLILEGESKEEVLFSSYLCHPSMANNELSGPLVLAFLYLAIKELPKRRYTYRFVLAPETIGTIAYLAAHKDVLLENVKAGYVLTCCGTNSDFVLKLSRRTNSIADRIAINVLKNSNTPFRIIDFDPIGSDERQYCSPGFNLPVASVMRSKYHEYPEYHTSLDNKSIMDFDALCKTVELYFNIAKGIELDDYYKNTVMFCEPNLGKRSLYQDLAGASMMPELLSRRMRLLNFLDGGKSIIDFCEKYNYSIVELENEIEILRNAKLIA